MSTPEEAHARLAEIPNLTILRGAPLAPYTRFGIGGPAGLFAETGDAAAFQAAFATARTSGIPVEVIGGGTNLVVSDNGFPGLVLRFTAKGIRSRGSAIEVEAGAVLQDLVDFAIARGLAGLETLAGIPGWVGGAIYGNAGAYGHSISERVTAVRFTDGTGVRVFDNAACQFEYRESVFKANKRWTILSAELRLDPSDAARLRGRADEIVTERNRKFPVTMRCAGSIFKNLLYRDLPPEAARQVPPEAIREGKVPAAWYLERVGAKGMRRGDIQVAAYHANLIYNDGAGTAADLRALIAELRAAVRARFGLDLEPEVQFVG